MSFSRLSWNWQPGPYARKHPPEEAMHPLITEIQMKPSTSILETKLLLTVEETASMLSLGRSKVYDLIAKGEIPSVKIWGSRRVPTDQLIGWLESQSKLTSLEGHQ